MSGRKWSVKVFPEKRDAWVGVFWDRPVSYGDQGQPLVQHLKVYVCLLPFLPILFHRTERVAAPDDHREAAQVQKDGPEVDHG